MLVSEPGEHAKSKEQINKQLFESTINSEWHENKDLQDKAEKVEKSDKAAKIICEIEQIIKSKNKNIIWLSSQQSKVFEKFKENAKFIETVRQFGYSKSTIIFKINIVKLINNHPKIKNYSLSLKFLKIILN